MTAGLAGLAACAALVAPAGASAAFQEGRAFLPGTGPSEEVVRDGRTRTLLVNTRSITLVRGDGTKNPNFGTGGTVEIRSSAVDVQSSGKILVLSPQGKVQGNATVTRLLTNGQPDPSFGSGGVVEVSFGRRFNSGTALTVAPGDKIVLAGQTGESITERGPSTGSDVIMRLLPNGAIDTSFGEGGRLNFGEASPGYGYGYYYYYGLSEAIGNLENAPGGAIIGQTEDGSHFVRVRANGTVDASFGTRGLASVPLPGGKGGHGFFEPAEGPVVLANGKLVVAGTYSAFAGGHSTYEVMVARLNANGRLDRSYGMSGYEKYGNAGWLFGEAAIAKPNGGIVIATSSQVPAESSTQKLGALALTANGDLDTRFGTGGRFTADFPGHVTGEGLALQPQRRVLVVGYRNNQLGQKRGTALARVPLVAGS